jgi:hypothetical protein
MSGLGRLGSAAGRRPRRERKRGAGEAYADKVLGVDVDAVVKGVAEDEGVATVRAAERRLRGRGIDPRKASYREYADALVQVSP